MADKYISRRPAGPVDMNWVEGALGVAGLNPVVSSLLRTMPCGIYKYEKGAEIISEGEPGRDVYIIYSGAAAAYRGEDGAEVFLGALQPGDIFGEIAFLIDTTRSATVRATADCEVIMFGAESFSTLTHDYPWLLEKVRETASKRILQMFGEN